MRILVTAGNTQTPIDRVRCITNVFSGRTGARIALAAHERGHVVTLLTSHPDVVRDLAAGRGLPTVRPYRTFDDLHRLMAEELTTGGHDALIHSAAVSDYTVAGVYAPAAGTTFDPATGAWHAAAGPPTLLDASAGKVKSHHDEAWLRLVKAPKLVDHVRSPWGFRGVLVKFKLEVGASDAELRDIAARSRAQSDADLLVANTLEGMAGVAFLHGRDGSHRRVERPDLPAELLAAVEAIHRGPAAVSA